MTIVTSDMSRFGSRERGMAADLLNASDTGFPEEFGDEGITIMMNMNSGDVFFTNEDYQVAMMNGNKLEMFYSCPKCGHEGFLEEMEHGDRDSLSSGCVEYLESIGALK